MFFVIFCTALVRYTWLSNSSRFFFPTISTFACFWSQWPTSLAVTSGREGVRTTSFKPWRPHRGSWRGATAIEENNGSRREQWLTSLTVWTVHSICTYMIFIYIDISLYRSIFLYLFWLADIFASVERPDNIPCCVSPTMRCGRLPSRSDVNKKCFKIVFFLLWRRDPVLELQFPRLLCVVLVCFATQSLQIALQWLQGCLVPRLHA